MSTRNDNPNQYENRQRAIEIQNAAAHTHRAAEHTHDKQEHLSDHEQSRKAAEHTSQEQAQTTPGGTPGGMHGGKAGHGVLAFNHDDIAARAYSLWVERGSPEGSADEDWFRAVRELRSLAAPIARA